MQWVVQQLASSVGTMKKPAASTVKARAVREKRLEDGMAKVVQPTGALVPAVRSV